MRIVVVGGFAPSLINFRGPLLSAIVARGHEVVACAPDADPQTRQKLSELGARYRHFPLSRTKLSPTDDLATVAALRKLIRQEQPDRLLAYTAKPVIYTHLAARLEARSQVFGMITGLGYGFGNGSVKQKLVGTAMRNLYRYALKQSSGILFQNSDNKDFFEKHGLLHNGVPITVVNGSGVDLEWYTPTRLPDEPVFLLISRLLDYKGVREYCQAAGRLRSTYPQARFLLAGYFDANPASIGREELAQWQRDGVIEFLGEIDDVRPAYSRCRTYVLPSYREGTSRTVLEAMAMGRPIITTDAPGCRQTIVDGRNGILVRARDVDSLVGAMERFILEPELADKMGEQSVQIVREKYDVRKVNDAILRAMGV